MGSHHNSSSFSSLKQLLEELENFVALESSRNGNPWISVTKLGQLFNEKYGMPLEEAVKAQGYSNSLKSFFTVSRRFSIYRTSIPQEFYLALLQEVVPPGYLSQTSQTTYTIKRSWKVDGGLLRMLRSEGAKELPSRNTPRISEPQPILVPEITSMSDLEIALMEIIKSLMVSHPKEFVTIALLSKKFRDYYGQPVRAIIRSVCPDMRLIDLLQSMPNLQVQEVGNDGQITLEIHAAEGASRRQGVPSTS